MMQEMDINSPVQAVNAFIPAGATSARAETFRLSTEAEQSVELLAFQRALQVRSKVISTISTLLQK